MKINVNNTKKLNAEIVRVEARASARTITIETIKEEIAIIEKRLALILNKKDWKGLMFRCDPHGKSFPASYKYSADSTQFNIVRGSSCWFITRVSRSYCQGPTKQIAPVNMETKKEELAHFASMSKNWG